GLAAGDSVSQTLVDVLPSIVQWPDSVYVEALADSKAEVHESNESDNLLRSATTLVTHTVASVTLSRDSVRFTAPGDSTLQAVVRDRFNRVLTNPVNW